MESENKWVLLSPSSTNPTYGMKTPGGVLIRVDHLHGMKQTHPCTLQHIDGVKLSYVGADTYKLTAPDPKTSTTALDTVVGEYPDGLTQRESNILRKVIDHYTSTVESEELSDEPETVSLALQINKDLFTACPLLSSSEFWTTTMKVAVDNCTDGLDGLKLALFEYWSTVLDIKEYTYRDIQIALDGTIYRLTHYPVIWFSKLLDLAIALDSEDKVPDLAVSVRFVESSKLHIVNESGVEIEYNVYSKEEK